MKTSTRKQRQVQRTVGSPRWLQKKMLQNLVRAAKSKVNPARTKKAAETLATAQSEKQPGKTVPKAPAAKGFST